MVEVVFTDLFEEAFEKLTKSEKQSARKAVALLGDNPKHPGLRVKKMEGGRNIWEARASVRLRMTFEMMGETITLRNVGKHDKALKRP